MTFSILAHNLRSVLDLKNGLWSVSRKFDGHGFLWDGGISIGRKADLFPWYHKGGDKTVPICTGMWSIGRTNGAKVIHAPDFFYKDLPKGVPLQGELWYNDDLQFVGSTIRKKEPEIFKWKKIKAVFYNIKPYELWFDDKEYMKKFVGVNCPYRNNEPFLKLWKRFIVENDSLFDHWFIADSEHFTISDDSDRKRVWSEIVEKYWTFLWKENNWEGLMLHKLDEPYECKRSWNLLKMKGKYETEATILGYGDGKTGKNIGKVGYIRGELTWDDKILSVHGGRKDFIGKTVEVTIGGLSDDERDWDNIENYFPIGSDISFTYSGLSVYGVPQSCNIDREVHT